MGSARVPYSLFASSSSSHRRLYSPPTVARLHQLVNHLVSPPSLAAGAGVDVALSLAGRMDAA